MEIGIPVVGTEEKEIISAIAKLELPSRLIVWGRMHNADLSAMTDCGVRMVNLSIPVSDLQLKNKLGKDRDWMLNTVTDYVTEACGMGMEVCVGGEDSSRADIELLLQVVERAQLAGARRFRFADTLGLLDPFTTFERIKRLKASTDLEIEMHAHDDLGMATANTVAAVIAGATHINTTVNGLGERAGNAPLEEAVMALRHLYGIESGIDTRQFPAISSLVAKASGRPVPVNKSIVGEGVFTHSSGIHVDGLLKNVTNYQGFDPAEVGREHRLVLGKYSGSKSVLQAYGQIGITLDPIQAKSILVLVREHAVETKTTPTSEDLRRFYLETSVCQVTQS